MKGNPPPRPGVKPGLELNGRKILLGVCGSIAAYKAVELTRLFVKSGARVQVVMTDAAGKFITPLTFETITGRHVFVEMFPQHGDFSPWHTEMASWPDLAVIAPASANHMARLAMGIADDLLTTVMLTLDRPRLICPAMNHRMWANPATQENLATLKKRGFRFVMPEEGLMARPGEEDGIGRLADLESIFREVCHIVSSPQDLRGVRVLVTGGRTEESWDPVRVLTNRSTGRMGFALAEEARERGADVVLIHGPTDVIPPVGVRVRRVTTAAEMAAAVKQEFAQSKIILMAAAVADYTFAKTAEHKIKKGEPSPEIQLVATEDILRSLADKKDDRIVVGFALETENLLENALKKLREKHLDIVVANNPLAAGSGFAVETNQVLLIHRSGRVTELPLQSKREAARDILNAVIEIYRNPEPEPEPEEVVLLDEEDDLGGLDLSGLEIEDTFPEEKPVAQMGAPASTAAPQNGPHPQGDHGSRRHKKHRDRDRTKPHGPLPQPSGAQPQPTPPTVQQPAQPHHPVEPHPAPVQQQPRPAQPPNQRPQRQEPAVAQTPTPAPAPEPMVIVPSIPRPSRHARPEPIRRGPAPSPAPAAAAPAPAPAPIPHPEPVMEDEETVSDLPGSMDASPAELPFPNVGPQQGGPKKSRGRRGGRRAQRARAKREAAAAGTGNASQPQNAPVPQEPVIIETAPLVVTPEPAPAPAPAPKPPAPPKETAAAPAVKEAVAEPAAEPTAEAAPKKAAKPRKPRAPRQPSARPKKAAAKTVAEAPAENPETPKE